MTASRPVSAPTGWRPQGELAGGVFEPLKAIDALHENDVDYVVVGGWGSLHYGATRLTQDLDICPELCAENLDRLA